MIMMVKLVTSACEEGVKRKGLKFFLLLCACSADMAAYICSRSRSQNTYSSLLVAGVM